MQTAEQYFLCFRLACATDEKPLSSFSTSWQELSEDEKKSYERLAEASFDLNPDRSAFMHFFILNYPKMEKKPATLTMAIKALELQYSSQSKHENSNSIWCLMASYVHPIEKTAFIRYFVREEASMADPSMKKAICHESIRSNWMSCEKIRQKHYKELEPILFSMSEKESFRAHVPKTLQCECPREDEALIGISVGVPCDLEWEHFGEGYISEFTPQLTNTYAHSRLEPIRPLSYILEILFKHGIIGEDIANDKTQRWKLNAAETSVFSSPWAKTRGILLSTIMVEKEMAAAKAVIRDTTNDKTLAMIIRDPDKILRIVELDDELESENDPKEGSRIGTKGKGVSNKTKLALKVCSFCSKLLIKSLTCSICQAVAYCSRDCQKAHWKDGHRKVCKAPRAADSWKEALSRHKAVQDTSSTLNVSPSAHTATATTSSEAVSRPKSEIHTVPSQNSPEPLSSDVKPGDLVQLHGLSKVEFNGLVGTIMGPLNVDGRYPIRPRVPMQQPKTQDKNQIDFQGATTEGASPPSQWKSIRVKRENLANAQLGP